MTKKYQRFKKKKQPNCIEAKKYVQIKGSNFWQYINFKSKKTEQKRVKADYFTLIYQFSLDKIFFILISGTAEYIKSTKQPNWIIVRRPAATKTGYFL